MFKRAGQADDLSQRLHFPALFFASKCSFPALTRNHRAKVGLSPRAVQHMQSLQRRAKHRRSITRHSTASKARLASGIIADQRHHGMRTKDSWAASTGTVQSAMRSLQQQNRATLFQTRIDSSASSRDTISSLSVPQSPQKEASKTNKTKGDKTSPVNTKSQKRQL